MPLFNGTLFQIDQKEMMRYAGLSPKVKEFPQDAIDSAIREALALAEPRGIWQILPYDPENGTIGGAHPLTLTGRSILRHLSQAWSVGVLAVTVGEEIEKASDAHFKSGEYLQGLLLDAAATAAVEHLADQVDALIQREAARSGQHTVWRFSPGYGDWPLEQQPELIRTSRAESIGVHLSSSLMLVPRKSVTAIIGLYKIRADAEEQHSPQGCAACNKTDCPSRKG